MNLVRYNPGLYRTKLIIGPGPDSNGSRSLRAGSNLPSILPKENRYALRGLCRQGMVLRLLAWIDLFRFDELMWAIETIYLSSLRSLA